MSELARSGCTLLLAIRFETFVESNGALWNMPVEGQGKKDLRRHAFMYKSRHVLEPESPVVVRMPHKTTALSIHTFQP